MASQSTNLFLQSRCFECNFTHEGSLVAGYQLLKSIEGVTFIARNHQILYVEVGTKNRTSFFSNQTDLLSDIEIVSQSKIKAEDLVEFRGKAMRPTSCALGN